MNRPVYEDEADRQQEANLARFVAQAVRATSIERTPKYYPCDWVLQLTPSYYALLELKIRQKYYEDYLLSLHKAAQLITFAEIGGFVPMLGVAWLDRKEVGLWNPLKREYLMPGLGGRRDRGDWQDVEPVVLVHSRFCQPLQFI